MRTRSILLTPLVLAVLSGCGAAGTTQPGPTFVDAPAVTSPVPVPAPGSADPVITTDPATTTDPLTTTEPAPTEAAETGEPADGRPPTGEPAATTGPDTAAAPRRRGNGPAGSLRKTGAAGVALTFDDGPDPVDTPRLLDLLKRTHVKATFCVVGQNVAAHPGIVRRIVAEGHTLCNHTWRHSLTLGREKPSVIRADLQRTNDAIRAAVPGAEIKYMRAPGGNFTPAFVKQAELLGMTSIYWQVDPRDWDHPAGESEAVHRARVIRTVRRNVSKGAIVLSHDYRQPGTITAYETLIPWLKKRYTLIALPTNQDTAAGD